MEAGGKMLAAQVIPGGPMIATVAGAQVVQPTDLWDLPLNFVEGWSTYPNAILSTSSLPRASTLQTVSDAVGGDLLTLYKWRVLTEDERRFVLASPVFREMRAHACFDGWVYVDTGVQPHHLIKDEDIERTVLTFMKRIAKECTGATEEIRLEQAAEHVLLNWEKIQKDHPESLQLSYLDRVKLSLASEDFTDMSLILRFEGPVADVYHKMLRGYLESKGMTTLDKALKHFSYRNFQCHGDEVAPRLYLNAVQSVGQSFGLSEQAAIQLGQQELRIVDAEKPHYIEGKRLKDDRMCDQSVYVFSLVDKAEKKRNPFVMVQLCMNMMHFFEVETRGFKSEDQSLSIKWFGDDRFVMRMSRLSPFHDWLAHELREQNQWSAENCRPLKGYQISLEPKLG